MITRVPCSCKTLSGQWGQPTYDRFKGEGNHEALHLALVIYLPPIDLNEHIAINISDIIFRGSLEILLWIPVPWKH